MRTVLLKEYGRAEAVSLSDTAVAQLSASRAVDVAPRGGGRYDLTAGSVVGTIVLPSLRLLIRPKVRLPNVFFLLAYGAGITTWSAAPFPYEEEPDLLRAIAWVFEAEVRRTLARGVARGYQEYEAALPALRGRLDVGGQLRARQGRPFPLACRFDEYTEDVTLNRVLRAAHERLLAIPALDRRAALGLQASRRAFTDVASVAYAPTAVPELRFTRLDRHWAAAGLLARLILQGHGLRDRKGKIEGCSFTVDMNTLFERFVAQVFREQALPFGWEVAAQAKRPLTDRAGMRPDLLLRRGGQDVAVADTKYKLPEHGLPIADLYQLLAYCVALGLPSGLLVYGGPLPRPVRPLGQSIDVERHRVVRSGIVLERAGIDLACQPPELLRQARAAAAHWFGHGLATNWPAPPSRVSDAPVTESA